MWRMRMTDLKDARLTSPAVFRNRVPILAVLRSALPPRGAILEIASGGGEHIAYSAGHMPQLEWLPSDPSPAARASITARTAYDRLANVRPPLDLDASALPWPVSEVDAIMAINMVHISPWSATQGRMKESGRLLPPGAFSTSMDRSSRSTCRWPQATQLSTRTFASVMSNGACVMSVTWKPKPRGRD